MSTRPKEVVETCPVYAASRVLGKRWSILIIQILLRPQASIGMRFSELQRELSWVSPKILTQRLREFQENELLNRTVDSSNIPTAVWYTLTEKGRDLQTTLVAMQAWGQKHEGTIISRCENKGFKNCHVCQH